MIQTKLTQVRNRLKPFIDKAENEELQLNVVELSMLFGYYQLILKL